MVSMYSPLLCRNVQQFFQRPYVVGQSEISAAAKQLSGSKQPRPSRTGAASSRPLTEI
jgi:hypothetical protein